MECAGKGGRRRWIFKIWETKDREPGTDDASLMRRHRPHVHGPLDRERGEKNKIMVLESVSVSPIFRLFLAMRRLSLICCLRLLLLKSTVRNFGTID